MDDVGDVGDWRELGGLGDLGDMGDIGDRGDLGGWGDLGGFDLPETSVAPVPVSHKVPLLERRERPRASRPLAQPGALAGEGQGKGGGPREE
eukprot:5707231-Pyramimonas_sp.AAC.1